MGREWGAALCVMHGASDRERRLAQMNRPTLVGWQGQDRHVWSAINPCVIGSGEPDRPSYLRARRRSWSAPRMSAGARPRQPSPEGGRALRREEVAIAGGCQRRLLLRAPRTGDATSTHPRQVIDALPPAPCSSSDTDAATHLRRLALNRPRAAGAASSRGPRKVPAKPSGS